MRIHRIPLALFFGAKLALDCTAFNFAFAEVPYGFTTLFNGKDLTYWQGQFGDPKSRTAMTPVELAAAQREADLQIRKHWKVVDGAITFDGQSEHHQNLCTVKDYDDFELWVDWKLEEGGDSGIYLRGTPQVNIWDTEYPKYKPLENYRGSGNLWNNKKHERYPLVKADKPVGEWNTFYIRLVGQRLLVKLNGKLVARNFVMENYWERDKPLYRTGPIELQDHGDRLWFRNIYVREIPASEANQILASTDEAGFEPVFNGTDLTGWQGDLKGYEVQDRSIVCRADHTGIIHTEQQYADFSAKLEFKLPPAGNNGLAIRYSGSGLAHIDGMTEIQILDSEHPQYRDLHPTQYHGSAYGLVPAQRGFLRATGEWNFQQVTVKGSNLLVELNGFTILDADLSQVKESKEGKVFPGASIRSGFFGFTGHNDPVAFRNIEIKELAAAEEAADPLKE